MEVTWTCPPGVLGWRHEGGGGTSARLPREAGGEAGRLVLSQARAASPQGRVVRLTRRLPGGLLGV